MRKLGFAAFFAFWSSVTTLMLLFWLVPVKGMDSLNEIPVFSLQQVAQHSTLEDCWMVIEGGVYNFSEYISKHPAPKTVLANWCGKEATQGMKTKGYGNNHSPAAWEIMNNYRIGILQQEQVKGA